jgi:hypothetical protein
VRQVFISCFSLDLRCRAEEAIAVVDRTAVDHGVVAGQLVLGTDNGTATRAGASAPT